MVLLALEGAVPAARLGLSVPRRTGPAPLRNRTKRRLREIFRRSPEFKEGARDLCLIVKPEAVRATTAELREEFHRLFRKVSSSGRPSAS